ncbi:MAG TPA: ribosome biogenesis GTPase Der, partial [Anaerolineae bacterium]
SNLATLLLSLFLAIFIWVNAIQAEDPVISKSLQIPINFVGRPDNTALLVPSNPNQSVQVVLEGPSSIVNQLTADDFVATVDLSQVPFGEEVLADVVVRSENNRVDVLFQSPEQINVRLEELVSRDIPVELEIRGTVARGHTYEEPLIEPESITVVGTSSEVEPLDFARVTVFLNNERQTKVESPQPIFYDRQGRVASVSNLELSAEQVQVTIPINEAADFKEVPITVDWEGVPAPGYRLLSISVDPPSVLVTGRPTQIQQLNRVQTEKIDITGLTETFVQQVALDLPEGIDLDEVREVFVTVEIEPIYNTFTYNRTVELQGLADELEATVEPEMVRVVLYGPLPVLETLLDEEVRVAVDLFGLDVGNYNLEPDVDFPDRGIELRSIQPSLVTVNITQTVTGTNELTNTVSMIDSPSLPQVNKRLIVEQDRRDNGSQVDMSRKALVALVGRPNVGKSTLFNRIIGRRVAVVSEVPGTTRDRLYGDTEWNGVAFAVVDTGGIEVTTGWHTEPLSEDSERYLPLIRQQATIAIQDADVVVQVVDGQAGITAADREVADILRRSHKPVIVAANKMESTKLWDTAYEFYELALGPVFPVSAVHGVGTGDLLDAIVDAIPASVAAEEEEDESVKIAILGRPNVGKSTLLNKLIGEERVIVSPIAGTTRDAIDTKLIWHGQEFTLIDTAGIRRRGKIDPGVEKYSVLRAIKALDRADVALLLLDAEEGITAQDTHIAGTLTEETAGIIVLVNKWDAIEKDAYTMNEYEALVRSELNFLPYVPVLFISAKTGQRVNKILPTTVEVNEARHQRIPTGELNRFMRDAVTGHPPPIKAGRRLKFFYATQIGVAPPTFVFFVNNPEWVDFGYRRYLENRLRELYPFRGTPVRFMFRPRSEDRFGK